jgi:glutamyl/glutaminyl-tRNA synthetase
LALLGWNDGTDKELYTLEELVEAFDLNRVHKAGAKFDPEKQMVQSPTFDQTKTKIWHTFALSLLQKKLRYLKMY